MDDGGGERESRWLRPVWESWRGEAGRAGLHGGAGLWLSGLGGRGAAGALLPHTRLSFLGAEEGVRELPGLNLQQEAERWCCHVLTM